MARELLVAEPDPLQRQLIDMLLAEDDYAITWTSTGKETLAHLKQATPDLALLKIALPDVTGAEICETMKRISRLENVPVVLVADGEEGQPLDPTVRTLASAVGADLLLPKPLGDKNLRSRLQDLVDVPRERGRRARLPDPAKRDQRKALDRAVEDLKVQARVETLERDKARLEARVLELETEVEALRDQLATMARDAKAAAEQAVQERLNALERRNAELEGDDAAKPRRSKRRRGLFNWRSAED